jgi:glycine dehydrogenase subunit 1
VTIDSAEISHPYIPNSPKNVREQMLKTIGAESIDELYGSIPESLRFRGEMNLPAPLVDELSLRRHVEGVLGRNRSCKELRCFRGGGCAQHYVPAICDEINGRSEFLTAYAGDPYEDHGRYQALYEYASLMGELLECDVVNIPTFDWNQAASTSIRMAQRITNRRRILIDSRVPPDRVSTIRNYCRSAMELVFVRSLPDGAGMDLGDLSAKLNDDTVGLYFENPCALGALETQVESIAQAVHQVGGLMIVGVDPISLGVVAPPSRYGADIVCGDLQPLGIHMQQGGGQSGFIATRDEVRFVQEYPSRLFGLARTSQSGEWGFGDVLYDDRTSFGAREHGKEFVGTATALWGITAGVYLALLGPNGIRQVGRTIMQNTSYVMRQLDAVEGLSIRAKEAPHFKEFVLDLRDSDVNAKQLNLGLLDKGILGGIDLDQYHPDHGGGALICVTEIHAKADLDLFVDGVREIVEGGRK